MDCKECSAIDLGTNGPNTTKNSKAGIFFAVVTGGSAVLLSVVCLPFVTPALRRICLPYVPATSLQVSNVFKALGDRKGTLIDLGSGDGRIVLEAAKQGYKAVGVELNMWLVIYSKLEAIRLGLYSNTSFHRKDIWKTPLKSYDNVVIFGVDSMMEELESKCKKEMGIGAAIAACRFPFPKLKPDAVVGEGLDRVWLYLKKA